MCGLSGIVVTEPKLIDINLMKLIFALLMEENDDRGGHSWGAWGSGISPIRGLGKYFTNPQPLHDHLREFKYQENDVTYLFGHTRYGTHGAHTLDNAHPFEEGNLTLAHNGVVTVEGYTNQDHEVDSGRIAKAIIDHGYEAGMAKVEGMCSLLVTVGNQPLIYRHEQVLNYATFPWGTVISSTVYDLEAVIKKRLGLTPLECASVPEDTFCQPGFGTVNHFAPGKKRAPYVAASYSGRGRWWEDEDEVDGLSTFPYERATYNNPYRGGSDTGGYSKPVVGFAGGNFSGKSDLPKNAPPKSEPPKVKRVVQPGPNQPPLIVDADDVLDNCEYCGYAISIDDLYVARTDWGGDYPLVMCMDCVTDEIVTNGKIEVIGPYGCPEMDRDRDRPLSEIDMLSWSDKQELESYIRDNYKEPNDV